MAECGCGFDVKNREQRKVLLILLGINALMFIVELSAALISDSTALFADSLDMLADAAVYGVSLYAVGKAAGQKARVALFSGVVEVMLGLSASVAVIRKLVYGSEPEPVLMVMVGLAALLANVVCLRLISLHREGGIHMRASWIFSKNDVLANLGVIIGGLLVNITSSHLPDLVIGFAISIIVIRGGVQIFRESFRAWSL